MPLVFVFLTFSFPLCSESSVIAKDIEACLVDIIEKEGGSPDAPAAKKIFTQWITEKRFLRDIWG
jgi:sulfite reductase alpha subunit-like flavoprotein